MVRTQVYLDNKDYDEITRIAERLGYSMAQIVRDALKVWLDEHNKNHKNSAQGLLKIAQMAEDENWQGEVDLAQKHDEYFVEAWEEGHAPKN